MAQVVNDEIWPDAHQLYDSLGAVTLPEDIEGSHIAELDVTIRPFQCTPPSGWLKSLEYQITKPLRERLHFDEKTTIRLQYGCHMAGPQTPGSVEIQYWLKPGFEKPPIISQRGIDHGIGQY
jgi:hypothetical protein